MEDFEKLIEQARHEAERVRHEASSASDLARQRQIEEQRKAEEVREMSRIVLGSLVSNQVPFDGERVIEPEIITPFPRHRIGFLRWGIFNEIYEADATRRNQESFERNKIGYWSTGVSYTRTSPSYDDYQVELLFYNGRGFVENPGVDLQRKALASLIVKHNLDLSK